MKQLLKLACVFCTLIIFLGCYGKETLLLNNVKTIVTVDRGDDISEGDTLVITCIDYRFAFANQEFINKNLGIEGKYNHISIPGSIYNLVNPSTREVVFSKITKFVNFHLTDHIVIIGHRDCGGYGGFAAFGSEIAEYVYLTTDLKKSRQLLIEKFPVLRVDLYLETLTQEGVQFEKVL